MDGLGNLLVDFDRVCVGVVVVVVVVKVEEVEYFFVGGCGLEVGVGWDCGREGERKEREE